MAEFGPVVCGVGCGILGHFGHAGFVPGAELDFRAIVLRPTVFVDADLMDNIKREKNISSRLARKV